MPVTPQSRLRRARAARAACLAAAIVALAAGGSGCERRERRTSDPDPGLSVILTDGPEIRRARMRAAERGIDWMTRSWRAMPPGWAYVSLSRLQRLVRDPERSAAISRALAEDAEGGRHPALPTRPDALSGLEIDELTAILLELERRREAGEDDPAAAAAIAEAAAVDEPGFWQGLPLQHRATVAHLFDVLDLPSPLRLASVTETLRGLAEQQSVEALGADARYVDALAGLVLARSDYYRQWPGLSGLEFAVPIFGAALDRHVSRPLDVFALDRVGEVVSCLQLLRVPDDDATRAVRRRIMEAQNADGSWGPGAAVSPRRIQPTFNAIAALLVYPDVLGAPAAP